MGNVCRTPDFSDQSASHTNAVCWSAFNGTFTKLDQLGEAEEEPEPEGFDDEQASPSRPTAPVAASFFDCRLCIAHKSASGEPGELLKQEPVYSGQMDGNMYHGSGILEVPGSYTYEGNFHESMAHGHGVYRGEDGGTFEGQWFKDKKQGHGVYVHMDGTVYAGNWFADQKSGVGTEQWPDGTRYKGEFFQGMRHGTGKYKSARGKYEGQFRYDKMEGQGRYEFTNGRTFVGQWEDGTMVGSGTMEFPDGSRYEGAYEKGLKSGGGVFTWPDGRVYKGEWSEGNQHGLGVMVNAAGVEVSGEWRYGAFTKAQDLSTACLAPGEHKSRRWVVQVHVHVRATPSKESGSLGVKEPGSIVKGHSAGEWLALADEQGFISMQSGNQKILLPVETSSSPIRPDSHQQ